MFLSELKLWNFRKYGDNEQKSDLNLEKPHLVVPFNKNLNVLIGENDSGKTAILDAIKLVLKTHAYEWIRIEDKDFYKDSNVLRIELKFDGISTQEAKNFTEWLGWEGENNDTRPILRLILQVERKDKKILPYEVRAGMDEVGYPLTAEAKEYLRITYLKALRDADHELIAKRNSRLAQILQGHELFKDTKDSPHEFVELLKKVNDEIKKWFERTEQTGETKSNKEQIKDVIDTFLQQFINKQAKVKFEITDPDIKSILEKITVKIENSENLGLGSMNRLYMAVELLHLKREWDGLKLALIEELEAHLHPQAQMKVIEALQNITDVQFILTTHSPNLASKVDIQNLIICKDNDVYPLEYGKTFLDKKDYKYLKHFLDVTKSNLFFARGVIIVEGWSEEILIPAIAKKIGYDLTKHEVSIVNVGSTAYLRFAKIFVRNDGKKLNIPVAIVTDLDVRPDDDRNFDEEKEAEKRNEIKERFSDFKDTNINLEIAEQWTLEWCLYKSNSLSQIFKESISEIHSGTDEFKRDEQGSFKPEFENKLIEKLKNKSLDKVAVANTLAEKILNSDIDIKEDDKYLEYIINAIKHVCNANKD